ncbi:flagellin N-terminal helical domain-containing protein [Massilia sp. SM-13]|uniref:flagellin N-terminal helical domain-containing protein n=1 Tax=Pseudoduganella rhizocola TaxID=3382643 RepID=UPI0038B54179
MQLTNTPALFALRAIERHGMDVADSLRRLSSGLRMSSARDDAAGLAISERMGSQLRGMQQANRNINDGISLLQTGEGALGTITDIFQRVRELAVQAASDTNNAQDRMAIQLEASALLLEAKRMVEDTNYNGISLLDGSFSSHLQIGANAGDLLQLGIPSIFHVDADGYNPTSIDLTSHADATKALTFLDEQILHIDMVRARMGAMQNRLGYASSNNATMAENLAASRSAILDTDFAAETARLTRSQILQQAAMAMLAQANSQPRLILNLLRSI